MLDPRPLHGQEPQPGGEVNTEQAKAELERRQQELGERQERVARHTRHRDEPLPPDFAEQAVELENGETLVALDKEISNELVHIEHALKRIEAGLYLDCEKCGEPIGEKRLQALPYVNMCIDCASAS
jgi:RNA polymerase-binding transcription factor DksA